jgi:hypothetical protein
MEPTRAKDHSVGLRGSRNLPLAPVEADERLLAGDYGPVD